MPDKLAILDGDVMDVAQATIPVTDEGLLRGDGVFEVFRLYDGRPFALDDHLARMERSAANMRLPLDLDAVRADVAALLDAARGHRDAARNDETAPWRGLVRMPPPGIEPGTFGLRVRCSAS